MEEEMQTRSVIISFKLPLPYLRKLDELITRGFYINRSEALRHAVILLLREHGMFERKERQREYLIDKRIRV